LNIPPKTRKSGEKAEEKMKVIVITGSTKGIGLGLAEAFLARGCGVVISGRQQGDVDEVVDKLRVDYPDRQIFGQACDVSQFDQVQHLWEASKAYFGRVDIWINNAGQAQMIENFWDLPVGLINSVVNTNVIGQMYGAKVAVSEMLAQGYGALYIMEGKGARGDVQAGMSLYSATKRAGNYLFQALEKELEGSAVLIGSISPGMVVTDLLTQQKQADPESWERTKKIFNILADKVETVAPWIVDQILTNQEHGAEIRWLNKAKVIWRFLSASWNKRDLFNEENRPQ
jgi:NAD(P)-dependent dehydrogenase (short-subunit alcohol dehydrogenase family)